MALGTCTNFQLEILIWNTISAIHTFRETIFKSSRNASETPPSLFNKIEDVSSAHQHIPKQGDMLWHCPISLKLVRQQGSRAADQCLKYRNDWTMLFHFSIEWHSIDWFHHINMVIPQEFLSVYMTSSILQIGRRFEILISKSYLPSKSTSSFTDNITNSSHLIWISCIADQCRWKPFRTGLIIGLHYISGNAIPKK